MARLDRPHIPIAIRLQVACRQAYEKLHYLHVPQRGSLESQLRTVIAILFGDDKIELHHRPALVNRPRNAKDTDYVPPANDPDYLVYLRKRDHEIETRVRGVGAQRSDLSQARYLKKLRKNREKTPGKRRLPKQRIAKSIKRKWPSRPFPKRNRKNDR